MDPLLQVQVTQPAGSAGSGNTGGTVSSQYIEQYFTDDSYVVEDGYAQLGWDGQCPQRLHVHNQLRRSGCATAAARRPLRARKASQGIMENADTTMIADRRRGWIASPRLGI
jgi:hypothetical protein